jgi:hypothetical protein
MPSMILRIAALLLALCLAGPAAAQSLSPLEKSGVTPSDRKAFRLQVGNPYARKMTFILVPMLPDYQTPTDGVVVKPAKLTMAPGFSRQVIVTFDIDPTKKERTIALCVMPAALDGPILPRVCGLYTGRMAGRGS